MERQSDYGRFALFILFLSAIFIGHIYLRAWLNPPQPDRQAAGPAGGAAAEAPGEKPPPEDRRAQDPAEQPPAQPEKDQPLAPEPETPEQWVAIGSADPDSPYRMLATLTNRGAAIVRIELNSPKFRDLEDRAGYLGHVAMDANAGGNGCRIDVVGPGTPAHAAGLQPGDVIQAIDGDAIDGPAALSDRLATTRPRQTIEVTFLRDGNVRTTSATLGRRPLELLRPEGQDPLSFLLTLDQVDQQKLSDEQRAMLGEELQGLSLRQGTWELEQKSEDAATFRRKLPRWGLELQKTYRLARVPEEARDDGACRAYHLVLEVTIHNLGKQARQVAYQLDGPTGLPTEGQWYASKVGRTWSAVGLRDVVVSFNGRAPSMIPCPKIAEGDLPPPWLDDDPLSYIGVDAQYFSAVLLPQAEGPEGVRFAQSQPLRVGPDDAALARLRKDGLLRLVNTSFRVTSAVHELKPGESFQQRFEIFAGPKRPALLAHYGLDELVYYGWFGWVAVVLAKILHAIYAVTWNYGIAIILLTALVRLCMFPLSKKQTLGAQKMQELQPKIREIHEKYKNNLEARNRAQAALFREHNYNPLSGCLVMFLQLPIFVALYRLLMVDVELRQAPLIAEAVRWCSNLAAPDMLFDWSGFWAAIGWESVNRGIGFFGLGPYFYLLPILTIWLFLWQQKKLTPPPANEQAAVQMKVMQFMMVFMGFLFFKVASGLCIYFIASSIWGLAERRFLPKITPPDGSATASKPPAAKPQARSFWAGNGPPGRKKRSRGKR